MLKKPLLIALCFIVVTPALMAQPPVSDKAELEKERQQIQNEMKQLQGMFDKVKGQKSKSLSQLNMLKKKINLQERYINSINRELRMIDDDIYRSNLEIYRLEKQVDTLKIQYARSVVYAYKNRSNYDYINFIFSATSFNDAIRRISYLKSYRDYREKQVNTILETQQLIAKRQQQQLGRKEQKNTALKNQVQERSVLDVQRREKDAVVSELKSQEKDLQKQLAAKKKRDREIKNAIDAIVKRAVAKAKEDAMRAEAEARKTEATIPKSTTTNPTTTATTPKPVATKPTNYLDFRARDVQLNGEFQANRGKLPWPVDNGFVSVHFGPYTIEGTDLRGNNPGVTIATPAVGGPVKAVFDGEVAAVHNYGDGVAIVIRHGKYFTSYSNLSGASVGKGAQVKAGQIIGRIGESQDGAGGQVDFMLMVETSNVNPELWLRR